MKSKFIIFLLTIATFLVISTVVLPANAAVTNLGNIEANSENTVAIDNKIPKFIKKPETYSISSMWHKTKGFETRKNTIKTKDGNKKYTFRTEYFLPTSGKRIGKEGKYNEYWFNCQAVALNGKYMYILSSHGYNVKKGFIVRYDMDMLNKYKLNKGKNLADLRKLGASLRDNENLTKHQQRIKKAIRIGPVFNTGHGQSLAYNPKTKSLWMLQDDKYLSTTLKLMKINMKTFKPSSMYKFTVNYGNNRKVNKVRNLDFDKDGNFYFHQFLSKSKGDNFFKGKLTNKKIKIELLATVKNRPGLYAQAMTINSVTNRLYMAFDGVFYSMPIAKLNDNTLTQRDLKYTILNTKREFEGLAFDKKGTAYLLLIRGTEILKSI
jgi:hypothetical protein